MQPILMIEDDLDDQFLVRRTLKMSNLLNPFVCCETAEDGLAYLHDTNSNAVLILVDLKLKEGMMDGFGFLREYTRLRPIHGWPRIPVIVLTGDAGSRARAEALGADKHLVKPVDAMKIWMATQMLQLGWSITINR